MRDHGPDLLLQAACRTGSEVEGFDIRQRIAGRFAGVGARTREIENDAARRVRIAGVVEAAAAIHDADITQAISARLARERNLREAPIKVQTLQGVVWLRGHVPSEAARSDAELLARTTDGVLAVRNRLDVVTR